MAVDNQFQALVLDQLAKFGEVDAKKMFGGIGLFHKGLMFGMIGGNTFKLKVDEHNKADYQARGMEPHQSATKKKGMPYWEVPQDAFEDRDQLKVWAQKSYEAAVRAKK